METGLLIEGGGLRGFFSAGILHTFIENGIRFPYTIGISSGALASLAYDLDMDLSSIDTENFFSSKNDSYFNWQGFFRPKKGLLATDRFFEGVPKIFDTLKSKNDLTNHFITATSAVDSKLHYWSLDDIETPEELHEKVIASCSIPVVMPETYVGGELFVDGGIMDSIPLQKMLDDGVQKPVLILTRLKGYVKKQQFMHPHLSVWLRNLPELKESMKTRHLRYNESLRLAAQLEAEGKIFVFRPNEHRIERFELDRDKAIQTFMDGKEIAQARLNNLRKFLES